MHTPSHQRSWQSLMRWRRRDVSDLIEEHGIHAYPFSPEKLTEFDEMEKARLEAQTLESLLVDGEHDFVIIEDGIKAWTFLFPLLLDVKL